MRLEGHLKSYDKILLANNELCLIFPFPFKTQFLKKPINFFCILQNDQEHQQISETLLVFRFGHNVSIQLNNSNILACTVAYRTSNDTQLIFSSFSSCRRYFSTKKNSLCLLFFLVSLFIMKYCANKLLLLRFYYY